MKISMQRTISDDELIEQKLIDAQEPGAVIEFDPEEAEAAGFFREDAISLEDAKESMFDGELGEE